MTITFSIVALIASFTISLLLGFLNFSFWYIQRRDNTPLWMTAWLFAGVIFTLFRLLQYAPLSPGAFPIISRIILTASYSLAWWGYGFGNTYIGYRPRRWERILIAFLLTSLIVSLWFSDLILTRQVILRFIPFGGQFHGVQIGSLYLPGSLLVLILGIIPPVRLLRTKIPNSCENSLLALGFVFVILFSLNDFLATALNAVWPRLSDYSYLPTSIVFSFIQVQRFGRLYQNMDDAIHDRTTELSQANETLRISEARYRLLFDSSPVGIILVNAQGQILEVNPSSLKMLGSPSAEATQRVNMFSFQPLIDAGITANIRLCFESGTPVDEHHLYTSMWGKSTHARVQYVPILGESGETSLVQLILEDTTERIQSEKLKESMYEIARAAMSTQTLEQLYRKIHELLQDFLPTQCFYIALYDRINDLLSFPYFQDDFDIAPPPAKPGRGMTEYILRTRKPLLASQEILDELTRKGEIELVGPESIIWMGVPLITHNQAIGVMVVQSYDETVHFRDKDLEVMSYVSTQVANAIERKQAEEDLHHRIDELTALYQTTLDIISSHDLQGILNMIVTRAVDLLAGSSGGLYLCDPQQQQVRCVVSYQTPEDYTNIVLDYGEGTAGTVASTGKPLIIDDYRTWEGKTKEYDPTQRIQAMISAPMLWQDQTIGVLHVLRDTEQRKFTSEDLQILTSFANQAAIAVENTRLFTEIQQRAGELEASSKVAAALRVAETIDEMLPVLLRESTLAVNAAKSTIYLLDHKTGAYVSQSCYPLDPNLIGLSHFPGDGITGHVAATGEIYITQDTNQDPLVRILPVERETLSNLGSMISLPLLTQNEIIGVIHFGLQKERQFNEAEVHLLTSIANMAANAIHRASLFESANRRLKRLSALHQIDQAIASSLDLHLTLNILLAQILQQLEVDAATVLLYQPEQQSLKYVAGEGFHSQILQTTSLRLGQGYAGRAALERRIVKISDLSQNETGFLRSPHFRNEGFVAYIGIPLIAKGNMIGVLEIYHRSALDFDPEWMEFLETLAGQAAIAIDNIHLFEGLQFSNLQLSQAYEATIEGWAQALELRDMETKGHSDRVVEKTLELALRMGVSKDQMAHIRRGALLHDIGKMGVPDTILQKPSELDEAEWEVMRRHPVYAYQMLSSIPYLKPALDIPHYHHENWDGSGYPVGLKGEQIPLVARIFAVVDVWDALNSDRPYRKAWPETDVWDYLRQQSGKRFDPQIVDTFIQMMGI